MIFLWDAGGFAGSAAHFLYLNNIVGGFIDEKKDCKYDFGVRYNLGDHA